MHGHALGGAGGIEAVAALLPLVRGQLPPTINLEDVDEDAGLDHVRELREGRPDAVLSNSFGFGGHNAALILRKLAP